jgi:tellurite resistance protein
MLTKSGKDLEEIIRKAMDDQEIRNSEYEEIIELAHADGKIDPHERVLLEELKDLIVDKVVKRIPG